jgi:DNA polymerase III sliding clamp (beta) subunit (PCNA family)
MTTTIFLKPNELESIALSSSTEESRYYLCGVQVESYDGNPIAGLIATDGHRMHSIHAEAVNHPEKSFILATADIKKALQLAKAEIKSLGKNLAPFIRIAITPGDNHALSVAIVIIKSKTDNAIIKTCASFDTKAIDGTYPDWRRIVPEAKDDKADAILSFQVSYVNDFGKAAKLLGSDCQQVTFKSSGSQSPILVTIPKEPAFVGVLMPMRA